MIRVPSGQMSAQLRRLGSDLLRLSPPSRSILVTGSSGGEGVSTAVALLALALAESPGNRVLVVDACLQSPAQHRLLGVPGESGLHDWSGEGAPPYRQVPKSEQLWLLPAGAGSTGTDHWLRRTAQLDKLGPRVRGDFDFVLWDTAALGREPDGLLLAPHVDGVLVVVESDRTLKERLRDLRERLDAVHLPVLGAIMNRCGRYWPWSNRLFQ